MKHMFVIVGFFLIVLGASQCQQSDNKVLSREDVLEIIQEVSSASLEDLLNSERDTTSGVVALALRVKPVFAFPHDGKDSIATYGFKVVSQTETRESMVTSEGLVAFLRDSIQGGGAVTMTYDSSEIIITNLLGSDSITITGFADSIVTADTLAAHLTDLTGLKTYRKYNVDNLSEISGNTFAVNSLLERRSTGARYLVQASAPIAADGYTVIATGGNYAVLQPINGQYDLTWFGATDDNSTDNASVFSRITAFDSLSDVVIKGDTFFTTGATINNHLVFEGGKIRNTGTINIRSVEDPGLRQIFTLSGVQKFTKQPEYVRPEWWGGFADSIVEVDHAIEACFESVHDIGGGTIQLDSGIYFMPTEGADISGMDVVIQGIKNKTKIVSEQGDASAKYIFLDVATGANYYNSITIKDVIFERGGGGNNYAMNVRGDRYKELNLIGCTFRHKGLLIDQIEKGLIEDCYFYTEGDFNHNGMVITGGCRDITIHRNVFRYLEDAITISGTPDQANTNITITDNYFDMGWMTGASEYTGTATYGAGTITDGTASFPSLTSGTTIRLLDTLSTGTGTYAENTIVQDGSATFQTDGVEAYDLVKVGSTYGLVDQVLSETKISVEFWMDSTTRLPVEPPSGDYVVYQLNYGEVSSNTATEITVTRFWNKNGGSFSPTNNSTIYEVLYEKGNYPILVQEWNKNFRIERNTMLRGWSDQISVGGYGMRVVGNRIDWGQDMGITCNNCNNSIISQNNITHQGVGGVWSNGKRNTISDNNIRDYAWENFVNTITIAGVMISGADSNLIANNNISSSTDLAKFGVSINSDQAKYNFINGNTIFADTAIQLYDGDSNIIGVNWPNDVNVVSATNTIYSIPTVELDGNGIYGSDDTLSEDHVVDMNAYDLFFEGSEFRIEMQDNGYFRVREVADSDNSALLRAHVLSFSNTSSGSHGSTSAEIERVGVNALEIKGPTGVLLQVSGSGSTSHIELDGGANGDIIMTTGDDVIITPNGQTTLNGLVTVTDSVVVNGISIFSGTSAPTAGIGTQGSLYMRNDNDSTLYTKTGAGWALLN